MNRDIAIIGMAGRFPLADNVDEFYRNLSIGRDCVRRISIRRIADTCIEDTEAYQLVGFLEDVDKFDYKFFGISRAEAEMMDPHQRIFLQIVYHTFENAGYNPDDFSDTRTGIYNSNPEPSYYRFIEKFNPSTIPGNLTCMTSGRLARFYNLLGPAVLVNTACSSSLVSIHMACNDIIHGEIDQAIVCSGSVSFFPHLKNQDEDFGIGIGTSSVDGKARAFSGTANGTVNGEVFASVLLKPLQRALADNDIIHAVIKSTAVNQDAARSSFLTAPSRKAQTEVIEEAWRKGGVDPQHVTYIEAHGTGTKIGDPIEISGMNTAFRARTGKRHFCAVSSLKSNIGHTDMAAGLCGLIKAVLSLKSRQLFPSLHFDVPNPLIDFENSAVYINDKLKPWDLPPGVDKRIAGVSSFGLSGTNCHVVLEEAPVRNAVRDANSGDLVFTFSSKTPAGLIDNLKAFNAAVVTDKHSIDVSYTLTSGRKHYSYRYAVVARSLSELKDDLTQMIAKGIGEKKEPVENKPFKLTLLFSSQLNCSESLLQALIDGFPVFAKTYQQCKDCVPDHAITEHHQKTLAFQFSFFRLLESYGLISTQFLSIGIGKVCVSVIMDKITLREGMLKAYDFKDESTQDLRHRLEGYFEKEISSASPIFMEMGQDGNLMNIVGKISETKGQPVNIISPSSAGDRNPIQVLVRDLYNSGYTINWTELWKTQPSRRRVELPGYQFSKDRCWAGGPVKKEKGINAEVEKVGEEIFEEVQDESGILLTDTERGIMRIWRKILKPDVIDKRDDFFDLGGNSLNGSQVVNHLEKDFGIEISFEDLLEYGTVEGLAAYVDKLREKGSKVFNEVPTIEDQEYYGLTYSQRSLWIIEQLGGAQGAYNLPVVYELDGLDRKIFEDSFQTLVTRHESLRTVFITVDGEPVQKVCAPNDFNFKMEYSDMRYCEDKQAQVQKLADEETRKGFALEEGPLLRGRLLQTSDTKYILLLTLHHIISDGWSMEVMVNEILTLYTANKKGQRSTLGQLRIQYKDYAAWQNEQLQGDTLESHREYWMEKFRGEIPVLELPTDYPRPSVKTYNGSSRQFRLSKELSDGLQQLSQRQGVTLYTVLLAGIKALLCRYTGQEEIIIGSPIAGRMHVDLESQIGLYINTLALRTQFKGSDSFEELLLNVKDVVLTALSHQIYPLHLLVDNLNIKRDISRIPLYDVVVVLQNAKLKNNDGISELEGVDVDSYDIKMATSQVDLHFAFHERENELVLVLTYNTDLYGEGSILLFFERLSVLLENAVREPMKKIDELEFELTMPFAAMNGVDKIRFSENF